MDRDNPLGHVTFRTNLCHSKRKRRQGKNWSWNQIIPFKDYTLWYVYSGKGELKAANQVYPLQKGSFLIMYPGVLHCGAQEPGNPLYEIYTHFSVIDNRTNEAIDASSLLPRYTHIEDQVFFEYHLQRLIDVQLYKVRWMETEFDMILKQLLLHIYRQQYEDDDQSSLSRGQVEKVKKVIQYIQDTGGVGFNHDAVSRLTGMNGQYASRIFKTYTGKSLKEYVLDVKMDQAKYLLSESDLSVTDISEHLGYSDIYAFSRMFKKQFCISPTRFRSKLRES